MPEQPFLVWTAEFELGIAEIDSQHCQLLERVNAFAQELVAGSGPVAALSALLHEAVRHFDFEEELMRRSGYRGFDLHAEQHSELVASMERLLARLVREHHGIDRRKTLDFLRDWFTIHIVRTDTDLARHLKALAPQQPA